MSEHIDIDEFKRLSIEDGFVAGSIGVAMPPHRNQSTEEHGLALVISGQEVRCPHEERRETIVVPLALLGGMMAMIFRAVAEGGDGAIRELFDALNAAATDGMSDGEHVVEIIEIDLNEPKQSDPFEGLL